MARWLAGTLMVLSMMAMAAGAAADPATPVTAASPAVCPVTLPNNDQPPGHVAAGGFGNAWLWTNLHMWGNGPVVLAPDDDRVDADGTIHDMKWAWFRYAPGELTVEGRRLDGASAPLVAWIPDGYGDRGFQVTGLTFPSAGCWQITGRVAGHELTFVTLVIAPIRTATPTPLS